MIAQKSITWSQRGFMRDFASATGFFAEWPKMSHAPSRT